MKSIWKVVRTTLIVLLCIETFLHFYNPFKTDKNNPGIEGRENARYEMKGISVAGLDKDFLHTKNSLGFRGSELPEDEKTKKIICMGGSGTECFYLNDGKDWPGLLGTRLIQEKAPIWLNNAGMAGSGVGDNEELLKKKVIDLKPDYIFLMCGLDDIGKVSQKTKAIKKNLLTDFYNFLELPKSIVYIFKKETCKSDKNTFRQLDLQNTEMLEMSDSQILQRIAREQPLIGNYKKHLQEIINTCKANEIKLVLISPVILFGDERDPVSDIRLGNLKIGDINGKTEALLLKQYNKTTYEVAEANNLPFINLSARLPKDSRYFYDGYHFTNDGAEMVANIIFDESKDLIKK